MAPKNFYLQLWAFIPPDTTPPGVPYAFYENRGQLYSDTVANRADSVYYYTNAGSPQLFVGDGRLSYVFSRQHNPLDSTSTADTLYRIDMVFENTNETSFSSANTYATQPVDNYLNYYLGYLPDAITHVNGYSRIVEANLYDNMDWQLYSSAAGLKSLYVFYPDGGRSGDFEFRFKGVDSSTVTNNTMRLYAGGSYIQIDTLVAYQFDSAGNRNYVAIGYNSFSNNEYGLNFESSYDYDKPLVVEMGPGGGGGGASSFGNIKWSTYLGGSSDEQANDIKTDHSDNVYVAGLSSSGDFPVITTGDTFNMSQMSYLVKFNNDGKLQWGTYIGGHYISFAKSIAINNESIPFVCGSTSEFDFPVVPSSPAYEAPAGLIGSAFKPISYITRFNPSNGAITWSSYFTGTQNRIGFNLTDNLYMVGTDADSSFPFTNSPTGDLNNDTGLACITKFKPNLQVAWATAFGSVTKGPNQTTLTGITAGPGNSVYMVGYSENLGSDFLPLHACNDSICQYAQDYGGGPTDGIIIGFDSSDLFAMRTYIGGSSSDGLTAIAADISRNRLYICGVTYSDSFPTTNETGSTHFQSSSYTGGPGHADGIFADLGAIDELGGFLPAMNYCTYYGGTGEDFLTGVGVSTDGKAYVTGYTSSANLVLETPTGYYTQTIDTSENNVDALVCGFASGKLEWSTYIGGSLNDDKSYAIAIDGADKLYITGYTESHLYPGSDSTAGYPVDPDNGAYFQPNLDNVVSINQFFPTTSDAFITKFDLMVAGENVTNMALNKTFTVFPNPTLEKIELGLGGDNTLNHVQIINLLGQVIFNSNKFQKVIDVNSYAPGMYVVIVYNDNSCLSAKFVKQ